MSFERLQALYCKVGECTSEGEQIRFLEKVRKENPTLYVDLMRLLHCSASDKSTFLEKPVMSNARRLIESIASEVSGTSPINGACSNAESETVDRQDLPRVPGFQLRRLIGKGGMGKVYLAFQKEPFEREVALKMIRSDSPDRSPEFLRRLRAETQMLALMNHDNIAKIYDTRMTKDGQPVLTMEYIDGQPIVAFCEARRLPVRDRIALLVQVCDGIVHAHRKGVIHGDLKPSNILVTLQNDRPVAKIIDFGIGRPTEPDCIVMYGARRECVFGSLAYMSPEQTWLGQPVDIRGDVYALGVLLFELLTGSPMKNARRFHGADLAEKLRVINTVTHPKPSAYLMGLGREIEAIARTRSCRSGALIAGLRGDLDHISQKSLAKLPDDRYETVEAMCDDLECYLDHLPTSVLGHRSVYRFKKYVRRNPLRCFATLSFASMLIAGTLLSLALGQSFAGVDRRPVSSVGNAGSSLVALRSLSYYCESLVARGQFMGEDQETLMPAVERGERELLKLEKGQSNEPEELDVRANSLKAWTWMNFGLARLNCGGVREALGNFIKAQTIYESIKDEEGMAEASAFMGMIYMAWAEYERAEFCYRRAISCWERLKKVNEPEYLRTYAYLGHVLINRGDFEGAGEVCETAYEKATAYFNQNHLIVLETAVQLAAAMYHLGRFKRGNELLMMHLLPFQPPTMGATSFTAPQFTGRGRRVNTSNTIIGSTAPISFSYGITAFEMFGPGTFRCNLLQNRVLL